MNITSDVVFGETSNSHADRRSSPLIATSIGHFTNDGTIFLVPVVIDLIAAAHDTGPTMITVALVLFYLSAAVSANIFGPTIDRKNYHVLGMIGGIAVLSIGLALFSLAIDRYYVSTFLVLSSVITGIGASFYHPTGTSILQSYYRGGRLGRYLGINGSAGSLGRAIYPFLLLLLGLFISSNGTSVVIFGLFGLALSFVMLFLIRGYRSEQPSLATTKAQNKEKATGGKKGLVTAGIIVLAVISLIRTVAFFGIVSWIPEYLTFERGVGVSLSLGTILTLMFMGGIPGQLFFGRLVEKYNKRMILVITTLASAVFMFLYIYTTGLFSLAMLIFFGFFNFSGFPIFMSMIADYVPRGSTTSSNALVWNVGGTGGQAIGPLVVGFIIEGRYSSLSFSFEILLLLGILSALIVLALPRPPKMSKVQLFG